MRPFLGPMAMLDLDAAWADVLAACPRDLSTLAKETGAVQRWRQVRSGEELLKLGLRYASDLSLRLTASATTLDARAIADTSVLDRLRAAAPFFGAVLAHVLADGAPVGGAGLPVVDATVVSVPGSTGVDWRVHARYDLLRGGLRDVDVTDASGGERLTRGTFAPGELVLGDRAYGRATGVVHVADGGAYALLRTNLVKLGATATDGRALTARALAARARRGDHETAITVTTKAGAAVPARLLVTCLSRADAARARWRATRETRKEGRLLTPEARARAGLVVLVTTAPRRLLRARDAFALYRARWQVELFFKRAKSLLGLDAVRAVDPALVKTYLLAKLILIALAERDAHQLQGLSPLRDAA